MFGISAAAAGGVFVYATIPIFQIVSGSMEPTLPIGSVVFEAPADALQPGDIITFQQADNELPITHTFIGYNGDGNLMTKGDANPLPDDHAVPLVSDDVIGRVVLISPLMVANFWLSRWGVFVVALAMTSIAALLWLVKLNRLNRAADADFDADDDVDVEADAQVHMQSNELHERERSRELSPV